MGDNALKTPLGSALNALAIQRAAEAIRSTGRAWPASVVAVTGAIITVKFEFGQTVPANIPQVTIPLFGPEYVRYPIQSGDKGMVMPADAYLGGMSGLGGGAADMTQQANLSNLVFVPIGNAGWPKVDANAVTIYGPNGVVLRDTGSASVVTVAPQQVTVTTQQASVTAPQGITLTAAVTTVVGNLVVDGEIIHGTAPPPPPVV